MDITNFNLRQVDLNARNFHSSLYNVDFPLLIPQRTYVKLQALPKETTRQFIPAFERKIHGGIINRDFLTSDEFYTSHDYQQFYRLIAQLPPSDKLLYLFFRNSHPDKKSEEYLEAIHESAILRQCADCKTLDERIKREFDVQFGRTLKECEHFFLQPLQDFEYLGKKDIFRQYVENRTSIIFDALAFLKFKGYSLEDFFDIASKNRIYPHFKHHPNALIETVKKIVLE